MVKITVTQILETRGVIEELSKARDEEREKLDKEIYHLKWDVYREKIKRIENERDNAIHAVEVTRDKAIAEKDKEIQDHYALIQQTKRILEMLSLNENKPLAIGDDEAKLSYYGTESLGESLGYLLDDDYLKIKLFIITNRKPKNRYSLIALGRSLFNDALIKYPDIYIDNLNDLHSRFRLRTILQFAPTPDELKAWLAKHPMILKDTLERYNQVKLEYLATKQEYTTDDFKELITWICPQCNNFKTIFDYESVGTPQCYQHDPYINMIRRQ